MNDKKGLNSYIRKINKLNDKAPKLQEDILTRISNYGAMLCADSYSNVDDISIDINKVDETHNQIVATDLSERPRIAYLEFGTGMVGMATYEGNLPMTNVPITNSWVYYYPSEYKVMQNGKLGWLSGKDHKIFSQGMEAQSYMWRASQQLRQDMINIARKEIKE